MSTKTSQSQPGADGAPKNSILEAEAAETEFYKTLSRMHREQLRPVGPVEQTLVETIVHNCFQMHRIQHAEREVRQYHHALSLINLGRMVRYRALLERSTRDALAQLAEVQRRRLRPKPAVMTATASTSDAKPVAGPQPVPPAQSAVHHEPTHLPIPRPIDQPTAPSNAARSSPPAAQAPPQEISPLHISLPDKPDSPDH